MSTTVSFYFFPDSDPRINPELILKGQDLNAINSSRARELETAGAVELSNSDIRHIRGQTEKFRAFVRTHHAAQVVIRDLTKIEIAKWCEFLEKQRPKRKIVCIKDPNAPLRQSIDELLKNLKFMQKYCAEIRSIMPTAFPKKSSKEQETASEKAEQLTKKLIQLREQQAERERAENTNSTSRQTASTSGKTAAPAPSVIRSLGDRIRDSWDHFRGRDTYLTRKLQYEHNPQPSPTTTSSSALERLGIVPRSNMSALPRNERDRDVINPVLAARLAKTSKQASMSTLQDKAKPSTRPKTTQAQKAEPSSERDPLTATIDIRSKKERSQKSIESPIKEKSASQDPARGSTATSRDQAFIDFKIREYGDKIVIGFIRPGEKAPRSFYPLTLKWDGRDLVQEACDDPDSEQALQRLGKYVMDKMNMEKAYQQNDISHTNFPLLPKSKPKPSTSSLHPLAHCKKLGTLLHNEDGKIYIQFEREGSITEFNKGNRREYDYIQWVITIDFLDDGRVQWHFTNFSVVDPTVGKHYAVKDSLKEERMSFLETALKKSEDPSVNTQQMIEWFLEDIDELGKALCKEVEGRGAASKKSSEVASKKAEKKTFEELILDLEKTKREERQKEETRAVISYWMRHAPLVELTSLKWDEHAQDGVDIEQYRETITTLLDRDFPPKYLLDAEQYDLSSVYFIKNDVAAEIFKKWLDNKVITNGYPVKKVFIMGENDYLAQWIYDRYIITTFPLEDDQCICPIEFDIDLDRLKPERKSCLELRAKLSPFGDKSLSLKDLILRDRERLKEKLPLEVYRQAIIFRLERYIPLTQEFDGSVRYDLSNLEFGNYTALERLYDPHKPKVENHTARDIFLEWLDKEIAANQPHATIVSLNKNKHLANQIFDRFGDRVYIELSKEIPADSYMGREYLQKIAGLQHPQEIGVSQLDKRHTLFLSLDGIKIFFTNRLRALAQEGAVNKLKFYSLNFCQMKDAGQELQALEKHERADYIRHQFYILNTHVHGEVDDYTFIKHALAFGLEDRLVLCKEAHDVDAAKSQLKEEFTLFVRAEIYNFLAKLEEKCRFTYGTGRDGSNEIQDLLIETLVECEMDHIQEIIDAKKPKKPLQAGVVTIVAPPSSNSSTSNSAAQRVYPSFPQAVAAPPNYPHPSAPSYSSQNPRRFGHGYNTQK